MLFINLSFANENWEEFSFCPFDTNSYSFATNLPSKELNLFVITNNQDHNVTLLSESKEFKYMDFPIIIKNIIQPNQSVEYTLFGDNLNDNYDLKFVLNDGKFTNYCPGYLSVDNVNKTVSIIPGEIPSDASQLLRTIYVAEIMPSTAV